MKNYDDIINIKHPTSSKYPRMSAEDRAAQFSPFAALTGYDDAVNETARLVDKKINLSEYEEGVLSAKINVLSERTAENPAVKITYFVPDEKKQKNGGEYKTAAGNIKKIDTDNRKIVLLNGLSIPLDEIYSVDGDIFNGLSF